MSSDQKMSVKKERFRALFLWEMNCKPGYVSDGHLSRPAVAGRLKRPTRTVRIHKIRRRAAGLSCSVLLRMGFTYAPRVTARAVVSCTAFAPLPAFRPAVVFCCTFLGVASTGRYPASCPVKPGLSSPAAFRLCSRDRPFLSAGYLTTIPSSPQALGFLQGAVRSSATHNCTKVLIVYCPSWAGPLLRNSRQIYYNF